MGIIEGVELDVFGTFRIASVMGSFEEPVQDHDPEKLHVPAVSAIRHTTSFGLLTPIAPVLPSVKSKLSKADPSERILIFGGNTDAKDDTVFCQTVFNSEYV